MSLDTGIPIASYQRYEAGKYDKPPYMQLYNCAIVLEVDVEDLIDDRFKKWHVYSARAKKPPRTPSWRLPRDE